MRKLSRNGLLGSRSHASSKPISTATSGPQANILHCCSRIKAHARKQVAKALLTSQPIEPGVHL